MKKILLLIILSLFIYSCGQTPEDAAREVVDSLNRISSSNFDYEFKNWDIFKTEKMKQFSDSKDKIEYLNIVQSGLRMRIIEKGGIPKY